MPPDLITNFLLYNHSFFHKNLIYDQKYKLLIKYKLLKKKYPSVNIIHTTILLTKNYLNAFLNSDYCLSNNLYLNLILDFELMHLYKLAHKI